MKVVLLTGGKDPHYARGLTRELAARGVHVVVIGSADEMLQGVECGRVDLLDMVGRPASPTMLMAKIGRVMKYYAQLLAFVPRSDARLFHILWFRRFPSLERFFLSMYLKLFGKKLVFTAHNVDDCARDGRPTQRCRALTLKFLYHTAHHVFVHTESMKRELIGAFSVPESRVTIVPLGINDVVPVSTETLDGARKQLGLKLDARVLLFFGNIAPYKGIDDLMVALADLTRDDPRFSVVVAGPVKNKDSEAYWTMVEKLIVELGVGRHVQKHVRYIQDDEVGLFFRAADVSILPYRRVYQSGVLGLSYAQGVPVIAADVGSMRDDIVEGETGFLFKSGEPHDLAAKVRAYFASELVKDLETKRGKITAYGTERFSWKNNAERTCAVYEDLLR